MNNTPAYGYEKSLIFSLVQTYIMFLGLREFFSFAEDNNLIRF